MGRGNWAVIFFSFSFPFRLCIVNTNDKNHPSSFSSRHELSCVMCRVEHFSGGHLSGQKPWHVARPHGQGDGATLQYL